LDYAFTSEASLTLWQLSIGGWMPCRETDESFFFVGPECREFPGGIPSWPLFLQYRKEGEIGWFRETGEGLRCRPRWPRQPYIFLEDYRWRYNYGNVLRFVPVLYGELKPGQTVRFGLELEPIREWLVESVTRDQAPPPAKDPAAWQTSTPAPPPFENDRRLQRTISLAEQGTPLPQVLEKLSAALNTPLRAAGAVRGETVSLTLPEQPAPALLKRLADAVHGVWRAEGPRYVLGERPDPDRQRGDQLLASGRYEEALEAYEKALARGANEAEAYQGKGKCYWYLHDYQNAIHHYEEVLLRDPDDPEAYIGLGGSYRALGEHEKAIGYFQELLKRAPDSVWGRVELGLVQGALNETEAAVQTFQEAARTAPGMWQPRYYLAEAYFQTGDFEKCQQTLREALKLPLDGPARNQLQELLTRAEAMTDH
jgi:tetratricopeptide (TPR) repeat protein